MAKQKVFPVFGICLGLEAMIINMVYIEAKEK